MGKWAEVACHCPNRVALPGGDSNLDRPHRAKRRLTAKQREDVEQWEQTKMNMFACGHRRGMLIELWPGNIIHVGYLVGTGGGALDLFWAIGNPMSYDNPEELLALTPEEAGYWLQEIEVVRDALDGGGSLAEEHVTRLIDGFVEYERRLAGHAEADVGESDYVARATERIREALRDAVELCRASITSGNPIRFLW